MHALMLDPVTVRWCGALFNIARRAGVLDQVSSDIERLGAELRSPAVRSFLFGGEAERGEKMAKLASLTGSFHQLTRNFVQLLFDRRRLEVLRGVAVAFRQRRLEESGVIEGIVESAHVLNAAEKDQLASMLGARLGKRVRLENRINPELVAGVRVFAGSHMIDRSVQGRMQGLRRKLLDAPLPVQRA